MNLHESLKNYPEQLDYVFINKESIKSAVN